MLDCDNNTTGWCIEVKGFFHYDNKCHFYPLNFEIGAYVHASRTFYKHIFHRLLRNLHGKYFVQLPSFPHNCSLSCWILDLGECTIHIDDDTNIHVSGGDNM